LPFDDKLDGMKEKVTLWGDNYKVCKSWKCNWIIWNEISWISKI